MDSEARDIHRETVENFSKLAQEIMHDTQRLVRDHVELAKSDLQESINETKKTLIPFAAGGVLAFLGLLFLLLTIAWCLSTYTPIPLWGSYGIVTLVCLVLAGIFAMIGRSHAQKLKNPVRHSSEAAKENITWLKERTIKR